MDQVTTYFNSGLASCQSGDYQNGIHFFDLALAINPLHIESLYNRAKAKYKINAIEACLEDFDSAIKIASKDADLYSERAVVYYRLDQKKAALDDLTMAIALEPENPYRYASRAYIKDRYGDFEGAIEDYNKAIALDPEDAISYNNKGLVEEKLGLKKESVQSFQKADMLTGYKKPPVPDSAKSGWQGAAANGQQQHVRPTQAAPKKEASKWQIIKGIFTSREGRNDFIGFVLDLLRRKK